MSDYKTHYNIIASTILEANKIPGVKLWTNPVGLAWNGQIVNQFVRNGKKYTLLENARPVKYGLAPGSCDTIGFKTEKISGSIIPRFIGFEIKAGKDTKRPKQKDFIDMVNKYGGIAGVVRKSEDIFNLLRR